MATYEQLHDWNLTPHQAVHLQKELCANVIITPLGARRVETVAGADISFNKFSEKVYAGIVVLRCLARSDRRSRGVRDDISILPDLSFESPSVGAWSN